MVALAPVMAALAFILPWCIQSPVNHWADYHELDRGLVSAVAYVESYGDPTPPTSYAGATGVMQITPDTAVTISRLTGLDPDAILYDLDTNIRAGCWYLRWLLEFFGGDVDLALAGYNAGPGSVQQAGYQVPLFARHYIKKVRRYWEPPKVVPLVEGWVNWNIEAR